ASDTPAAILILTVNPKAYLATLSGLWPLPHNIGEIELLRGGIDESTGSDHPVTKHSLIRLRAVPGTPWTLRVSEDRARSDAVIHDLAIKSGGISLLMVVSILMITRIVQGRARRKGGQQQVWLQAHEHFRGTFEQVAVGLAYTDAECRILKTNAKLCELLGKTADDLIGVTFKSLHLADGRTDQSDHLRVLLEGKLDRLELDKPYLRSAQTLLWFHITISLFLNEDGSAGYFIWVFEDITRRHEAEESLLASESIYKALFEHSPIALMEQDYSVAMQVMKELKTRGIQDIPSYLAEDADKLGNLAALVRITHMNKDAQKLLGVSTDREIPESLSCHYLPESFPVLVRQLNSLLNDCVQVREEMPLMTASGQTIWTLAHLAILPGHEKDYRRGLVSFIDITERQQIEQRLLSLNAELELRVAARTAELMDTAAEQRAIFESVFSGIYWLKDWLIVRCNQRLGEIYGYNPEEMMGQPVGIFHPDTESFQAAQPYYDLIGLGETVRFDMPQIRKDGAALFCRVSGRLLDAANPEKGSVWVVEDITQEHEMTEALLIAKNSAETANRSKNTFLANIGHEIRTPLNAILGYSHLLQNDLPEWRHRDKLKRISVAAQHLLEIINDIQDISKIEAGKFTVDHARFSLDETLNIVYNLVVERADTKGLEIISDINPEVSTEYIGDSLRLGQVLLNLLSNAVKFTHQGFVRVRATSIPGTDPSISTVRFEVTDTGVGIDPEAQTRLFRPFEQADDSINRQFGGTGLGLALSRRLIQMMGGQIGLWSTPGKGSTFWFTLPLKTCVDLLYSGHSMVLSKPVRGLLVDDQPLTRVAVGRLLTYLGVAVDCVESGVAALEYLAEADTQGKPYDLAIIDCKMPGMTGVEVINRIDQRYWVKKPLCLLMLTTLTDCAQQAGFFLTKPITRGELRETLTRMLKEHTVPNLITTIQPIAIPT
ncbi:MAG: PAS domain S-box protein, partial [Methylococcaceae bacterium]